MKKNIIALIVSFLIITIAFCDVFKWKKNHRVMVVAVMNYEATLDKDCLFHSYDLNDNDIVIEKGTIVTVEQATKDSVRCNVIVDGSRYNCELE